MKQDHANQEETLILVQEDVSKQIKKKNKTPQFLGIEGFFIFTANY